MSNGNTVSRILSQLVDAEKRNEIESPTARVARARQETQELHQRINRLSTYNKDNVRDYTEDDTQSNGLFEFGKMVKDNTVRTVRGLDQSRRRLDVSQNTEAYNFSPEQRNVEDLLTSGKKNQEKMNYLREAIKESEAKGQTENANFYKQELIQTQRLKTLYGLTPSEASVADSPVTNVDTANQINEGMAKYGRGGFSRKENQIESLQNTSLSDYVNKNAARLDLGQEYESLAAKRASQDNFQAIRDRQKTFAGEDGEQGADSFINSIKALGENPDSIAYNAGQLLPYMIPGVGTLQFLADMDNFANTTENNAYADTGRGMRTDEERDRAAIAYGLNIPVSYLDRLLGKAATGGAGVGGKVTGAISAPISKANEKIIAGLAGKKSQAAYKGTTKALGATTKAGLIAGVDTGTEILQEGSQTFLEQVGSNRKIDLAEISEAAAIGGGVGGAASISGAAAKGIKYASGKGINKVKEKVAESREPMNDDEYLDSNSKKYSPVSVVEDANKALSTGNASRETIKKSKARIANAKKSVNKEIQELERIVSLKTKQQQLVEQFKDADSISDADMKIIEDNAEAIQNLPYSIKLDVAQDRLTAAREAKISMEAEVSRAEAKVAKESKRSTNVAKATKIRELLTEQETNRSRIEEIDAKLADTNISDTEASTLENEKLEIQNSAMKTTTQISKLDPDGLISEIEASNNDTTISPKNIKDKLSGILNSPEVTANVSKKAELEELARKLDSVTAQQNSLKKTDSVKGDIVEGGIEGDRKYIGTKEHLSNSIKAVDNNDNKAYNNQMRMLENFEASHTSKAKAMNDASAAFNETGKTQLVYREEGKLSWTFAPKTFFGKNSTRDKKKFGALEVHEKSGRLIKNIEDEANHIKETREFIEEYKAKVANNNSTSTKGKNNNGKTGNNSNATGSTNTDSNKSKKVKSNKPKVNPVKNKNKNMITSWRQKADNSGETNRLHDSVIELYVEKNKGLKGKPVDELVLRDDERHAYNALSYLANKTIIAPNVNDNNVVWESFAEDAFGENTNAGNYSKDDVVMLVMPQTVTDFNALTPELNKALVAGAEIIYMNVRHTNNEVTKELITDNLVAVVKSKGYTLVKDKSQNKINLGTKVEIFKAVKEESSTEINTDPVNLSVSNDEVIKRGWNDKKIEGVPNYEVSSQGNKKFSALYAILKDGRSIEEAYQLDVNGYREIAEKQGYKRGDKIPGKGKTFITSMTEEEGYQAYKNLWETYLKENPELAEVLIKQINAGSILTDSFARTVNNQARALAEITKESIANNSTGTKTVAEYKEDWKKISEGALKSKWQEDYLNKYSRNKDKGEDYLKSLFPNATKDKEGNFSQSKWDAFVEFVEESNAASVNTVTSSKSGLVHTVPELLINKTYVMSKQLEAIKEVSSGLLDSDTEAYTTGLRDVFLDIIVGSKLPVGLTLLTDPKKIAAIERRKGNGEFIADAWIRGNNTEVRINLNNSFKDVDVKTILTHELSHIVTIAAVNKISDTNSPLDNRLKSAITVLTNWLDNNKDTLDVKTFNSLTYSLIDSKEFVAVNTTQEEAINQLINIPFGESNLYQEVVAITIEAMKETYGNKITPQIEERINVLSSEYETKRREIQGNNEAVSTDDGTPENGVGETGGSTTTTGDQQLSGPTSREGQTDSNVRNTVTTTENEVTQGNKTLLSQDEDIFTSVVLARDWERISEQIGIEIEDNNIRQLEAYIEFHETITKGIEKLIDKRDAPSNLNNALFKYLAVTDDTGKIYLPNNVVAAISLSAFKYIQTEGKKLKLTDAQLLAVHGLDAYTRLYPQAKYKLSELGGHKAYMSQDMGKLAYAALDLSIGDNARVNTKQELEASLGAVVYTLLKTNTDLIKEQPPMKHRDQLIRLVQSMPMGQAKDLVASKTTIDVITIKNKNDLVKAIKESNDSY